MPAGEDLRSPTDRELAALGDRLRAAQRDGMLAMTAIGALMAALMVIGRW